MKKKLREANTDDLAVNKPQPTASNRKFELKVFSVDHFHVGNIRTIQNQHNFILEPNTPLNYDVATRGGTLELLDIFQVTVAIKVAAVHNDIQIPLSEIEVTYDFELEAIADFKNAEGMIEAPMQYVDTFLNIAISTTRGIYFEKLNGTFLKNVFLPLVKKLPQG